MALRVRELLWLSRRHIWLARCSTRSPFFHRLVQPSWLFIILHNRWLPIGAASNERPITVYSSWGSWSEIDMSAWWEYGPIFREVIGKFDLWRTRRWRSGFKSARSEPCNHYTTAPLVINQAQLDWPRQEGFSCKRIEEHKQENINTQSEITDMNDADTQMRVQELGSKGLINTVEEIKNGSPRSL